ncbi:putative phosphatidylglycerol/phosphatidylinositol transfer protein [Neurospora crassa]|uniref:Phosphatidylglycerol/phosphatidylinositol transfer protein n=4 Tax=Neurospora TaxID=5140 RepID=NPC2_NEUCR|nr:uncharacterized protein NEUTE1DRAFT_116507 [Neurospora tetrasperma FGSC 2508]XP_957465.1 phosphatidylglycerol/phosphatidylinositol transfer protein [Neurospora crassa OR74A]Q7RZ85.1 RecName: Full=Phosphatidylglycerol/phosphatidylinositol transfer protein; Short=PG/PI-TP; Flags: Precursor [Neurospora crassa OR74A]EGZ73537.1 putative phosphatidylglycerol/phosphatidylinositol transfer protein [Neurospora tetrasperma FGSC 2509]KAK3488073.1 putative phosphatidylglycerol/phosphatidylinositol trans|eukprot:XP_957465.1 phosphatidylglycerol/phosphatidylinositol transfer protein [Neurospora crassa OR74A]
MRLSAAVIALLSTSAAAFSVYRENSVSANDELDVPGKSPLRFCDAAADRKDDIVTIEEVILTPNPPEAGQTLTIEASGIVKEAIEEGAYVNLQVKYGYIRLINTSADLCKEMKNVELECPIKKGRLSITKNVELPKEIPPGKYTVEADVYNSDDKHITCLTATVFFGRKTLGFLDDL